MSIHVINKAFGFPALILSILIGISSPAHAEECTLIVDAQTGATVEKKGHVTIDTRLPRRSRSHSL